MITEIQLSVDDFQKINWESIIDSVATKTCENYSEMYFQAYREAENKNDHLAQKIYLILYGLTSLMLKPEASKDTPFVPMYKWENGSRSTDISDFTIEQINLFAQITSNVTDPELRARLADVIWNRRRQGNYQFAEKAIEAYLLSGKSLLQAEYPMFGVQRLNRAIRLAASLGRRSTWLQKVVSEFDALLDLHQSEYDIHVGSLISIMLEYRAGDPIKHISIAEKHAQYYETQNAWYQARYYWNLKAKWHHLTNDIDGENAALINIALSFEHEAKDSIASGRGHSVAAHHLQSAIEAYRRIPGTQAEQERLHQLMLQYQEKSVSEFGHSSRELDITRFVEEAYEKIKNKNFIDALLLLANIQPLPDYDHLEQQVENMVKEAPLMYLFTTNILNPKGKIIGHRPPMMLSSPEEIAEAKKAEAQHWALMEQNIIAAVIEPTRQFLMLEHNPNIEDILQVVTFNPFVPVGRELIFAKGLLAGLQGDYLSALHFLIPQIENSLRDLLNRINIITSSINSEGIQEEFDLNRLLEMPQLKQIFDNDVIFALQGVLVSRFGGNFRNKLAHGLLDTQDFYSYQSVYAWWLILHICCIPIVNAIQENKKES